MIPLCLQILPLLNTTSAATPGHGELGDVQNIVVAWSVVLVASLTICAIYVAVFLSGELLVAPAITCLVQAT